MTLKWWREALCLMVAIGAVSGCSTPTYEFSVQSECDEAVAVRVAGAYVGGTGFTELGSGQTMTIHAPVGEGDLGFSVFSDLSSGSPNTSYVTFNPRDLQADDNGVLHLVVGPDCEAVDPVP